jgi:hypothetical protein
MRQTGMCIGAGRDRALRRWALPGCLSEEWMAASALPIGRISARREIRNTAKPVGASKSAQIGGRLPRNTGWRDIWHLFFYRREAARRGS